LEENEEWNYYFLFGKKQSLSISIKNKNKDYVIQCNDAISYNKVYPWKLFGALENNKVSEEKWHKNLPPKTHTFKLYLKAHIEILLLGFIVEKSYGKF